VVRAGGAAAQAKQDQPKIAAIAGKSLFIALFIELVLNRQTSRDYIGNFWLVITT
jgi:hypothetical protein